MDEKTTELLRRAARHLRAKENAQALALLAEAVAHEPDCEDAWTMLGFALDDHEKKVFAFKKVLAINPANERAQRQLEKLTGTTPKPPAAPDWLKTVAESLEEPPPAANPVPQPETEELPAIQGNEPRPRDLSNMLTPLLIVGGIVGLVVLVVAGIAIYNSSISPAGQVPTLIPFPTATRQPGGAAGLPPTWTPTTSPTPAPTLTPTLPITPTETATPARLPLLPAVQTEMANIQQQVADLRGLPITEGVNNELMPLLRLRLTVEDLFFDEAMYADLERERIVLTALGFLPPDYDVTTAALNGTVDGIGGFYLPDDNRIHVIGTSFQGIEQYIYSHEFAHALVDMSFDLNSQGVYPHCQHTQQHCLAIRALAEGDATWVEILWYEAYGQNLTFTWAGRHRPTDLFKDDEPVPPYYTIHGAIAYYYGAYFVSTLYDQGGWDLVNRAWRERLPATTEQIMHPEKFLEAEGGIGVDAPSFEAALGEGWALIDRDSLGEWDTALLLGYTLEPAGQRGEEETFRAAAGWGGDTYQVYLNAATGETAHSVQWTWDTAADQDEFWESLRASLAGRYANAAIDGPGNGECWLGGGQITCIYQTRTDVLWLSAPALEQLEAMKALFPSFQ
ncbi:MAG: hypothetical protein EPO32_05870 [Anaerolineae bacterium]|nr:MAG: hypothetical protein EPO32_05870 [Anaerolineae bacterium]